MQTNPTTSTLDTTSETRGRLLMRGVLFAIPAAIMTSKAAHALIVGQAKVPFAGKAWSFAQEPFAFAAAVAVAAVLALGSAFVAGESFIAARRARRPS